MSNDPGIGREGKTHEFSTPKKRPSVLEIYLEYVEGAQEFDSKQSEIIRDTSAQLDAYAGKSYEDIRQHIAAEAVVALVALDTVAAVQLQPYVTENGQGHEQHLTLVTPLEVAV